MCPEQLILINQYIENTFELNTDDKIIEIHASGYSINDRFYLAKGSFNFIHTCNNWVNEGLKAAKVKTAIWSPMDKGVLYQVRRWE